MAQHCGGKVCLEKQSLLVTLRSRARVSVASLTVSIAREKFPYHTIIRPSWRVFGRTLFFRIYASDDVLGVSERSYTDIGRHYDWYQFVDCPLISILTFPRDLRRPQSLSIGGIQLPSFDHFCVHLATPSETLRQINLQK